MPQMDDIYAQFEVSVTEVFGLNAAVVAILLWRVTALRFLIEQVRLHYRYRKSGFSPPWVIAAERATVIQGSFALGLVLAAVWFFVETFHYVNHINELPLGVGSIGLDHGLLIRMVRHSQVVRAELFGLTIFILLLSLVDSLAEVRINRRRLVEDDIPRDEHPYALGKMWTGAHFSLWQFRRGIAVDHVLDLSVENAVNRRLLVDSLQKEKDDWRWNWCAWVTCVVAYHYAVSARIHQAAVRTQSQGTSVVKTPPLRS